MIKRRQAALWAAGGLAITLLIDAFALPALIDSERLISLAHDKNLLQAAAITAHLELLPLLTGQVRIKRVSVDGLQTNLEIAAMPARC